MNRVFGFLCIRLVTIFASAAAESDARLIQGTNINLGDALQFLREYDIEASNMCYRVSLSQWKYSTNMTDFNKRRMIDEQMLKAKFDKISWKKAVTYDWNRLPDPMARRQLKLLITNSRASLTDEKYNEIHHLIAEMKDIYNNVRICPFNNFETRYCDLILDPDVRRLMAHSRNIEELGHVWKEWHDKTGPPMKNKFMRYVQLANQASRMNGFNDAGEQMEYVYEDSDFKYEMESTWKKLEPLYKELFTYVRRKLLIRYGTNAIRPEGPIPAHLLGDIWAQDWSNLIDFLIPYPHVKNVDVSDDLLRQGFTALRMFQLSEEFYTSLGMKAMPPEFWRYSLLEKPNDRRVQCTASAWDFCNRIDYRIKQCTEVNMDNLISTHHEMAHIQYYMHYADQPYIFRDGANPGFHEAIANTMTLSVYNPVHFRKIGLFHNNTDTYELNMNFLMTMALKKIAYAPFAYLVDQWRNRVFRDGVQNMNSLWWELRLRYQGIVPPFYRTEQHLDAAAKKHIPSDIPYVRYYVALILEFQIYDALCASSGHPGQLHTCDIYKSREAGRILSDALKIGRARHWKDVIRMMTRGETDRLSAEPLLKYFHPLLLWLRVQNRDESVIGWNTNPTETSLFLTTSNSSNFNKDALLIILIAFVLLRKII